MNISQMTKSKSGCKKSLQIFSLIAVALFASSCNSNIKRSLGIARSAPDEFRVIANQPLAVPPEFSLRPPSPGEAPLSYQNASDVAAEKVFNSDANSAEKTSAAAVKKSDLPSGAESSFLGRAGAFSADPKIRAELDEEEKARHSEEAEKSYVGKTLDFLRGEDDPKDPLVAAGKEKERISDLKADGKSVDSTPVATQKTKDRGVLGKVIDIVK